MRLPRFFTVVVVSVAAPLQLAHADPPDVHQSLPEAVLVITDAVLSRHVDPPTRQEMVLGASRAICETAELPMPGRLSEEISNLAGREQLLQFLHRLCDQAMAARDGSEDQIREAAIQGLLNRVSGDPNLIPNKEARVLEQFQGNRYVGIGVALFIDDAAGAPRINVLPGGPAKRAGARTGDLILEIDSQLTKGMELQRIIDLLRDAEGTSVTLLVRHLKERETRTLQITRGVIVNPTIHGSKSLGENRWDFQIPSKPIAYFRLGMLSASTVHELRQLERELDGRGIGAIILDLRHSHGGTVHHATILADALLPGGLIGQVRTADGVRRLEASPDCLFRNWPMAVLVSRATGGSQEWLAAGLQDRGRAMIVGERTNGDGLASEPVPLPGSSQSIVLATTLLERIDGRALRRPHRFPDPFPSEPVQRLSREHPESVEYGVEPDHRLPYRGSSASGDTLIWTAVRLLEARLGENTASTDEEPVEAPRPSTRPGAAVQ